MTEEMIELTPVKRYFTIRAHRYRGASFKQIGDIVGISKQRACKIFHSEIPKKTNKAFKAKFIEKDLCNRISQKKTQGPSSTDIISS